MTVILQRLELVPDMIGDPLYSENRAYLEWTFSEKLANRKGKFFAPLVTDTLLNTRYSILCMRLTATFAKKKDDSQPFSEEDALDLTCQLIDALAMAELLADINHRYLGIYREVQRLKNDQEIYRTLLEMRGFTFCKIPTYKMNPILPTFSWLPKFLITQEKRVHKAMLHWQHLLTTRFRPLFKMLQPLFTYLKGYAKFFVALNPFIYTSLNYLSWIFFLPKMLLNRYYSWCFDHTFTQQLRANMAMLNWPRLFSVRIRRIFIVLQPLLAHVKGYANFIAVVDPFIATPLNYLSWLFFLPRLLMNLFLLLKHLIPHPWMSEEEKKINFFTRLHAQLQRRFFDLLNDSAWFTAGLLGCFFLAGPLAPIGMCVNISVFFLDALAAASKTGIELRRLSLLQAEYQEIAGAMKEEEENDDQVSREFLEIMSYQKYIEQHFSYEKKRLFLGVINASALFLAMLLALPMITNFIVPVVGACLVVLITLSVFLATKWLETQKPAIENDKFIEKCHKLQFADLRFFPPADVKPLASKRRQLLDSDDDKLRSRIHGSASTPNLTELDLHKPSTTSIM